MWVSTGWTGMRAVAPSGSTTDRIPAERLVVEGALLDVADRCAENPDFVLEAADLEELERRDGEIAEGSAVLLRTGWEAHLADPGRYLGGSAATTVVPPCGLRSTVT